MDPTVGLAGASGGVYALLTAHVGTIIMVSMITVIVPALPLHLHLLDKLMPRKYIFNFPFRILIISLER